MPRRLGYDHAIREFVAWYCSEPRLAFTRTVVLRGGIAVRLGNWPMPGQGRRLLERTTRSWATTVPNCCGTLLQYGLQQIDMLSGAPGSLQTKLAVFSPMMTRSEGIA